MRIFEARLVYFCAEESFKVLDYLPGNLVDLHLLDFRDSRDHVANKRRLSQFSIERTLIIFDWTVCLGQELR